MQIKFPVALVFAISLTCSVNARAQDDVKIIPGHGPLADLQAYRDMLATAYERWLKLKNEGFSVEAAIAVSPLKDLEQRWSGGIFDADKWVDIGYPAVY